MQPNLELLLAIALLLNFGVLLWLGRLMAKLIDRLVEGRKALRRERESLDELRNAVVESIAYLREIAAKLHAAAEPLAAVPVLFEGLTNVTKEQVGVLLEVKESVKALSSLFVAGSGKEFQSYDPVAADRAHELENMRKIGITDEDARARVDDESLWRGVVSGMRGGL